MTHRLATIIKNNGGHIHTNPETNKSGTVHLGGTPQQMITAEQTIHQGKIPHHPFIMICQQDNTDPTRRPQPALLLVALVLCGCVGCVASLHSPHGP